MDKEKWQAVDSYIIDLFHSADEALEAAQASGAAAGLPDIAVTPVHGRFLHLLARLVGARSILEIGTLGGYSTIWLARALPQDGRLVTLEYSPLHAEVARSNVARAGLAGKVDVIVGKAADSLQQLAASGSGPFDFIFIDADKPGYADYLDWSLRLSRPGTLIVADNVVRQGQIVAPDGDDNVRGIREFNRKLAAEPRVDATILQTVGSKGYDGLAIAIVKAE